MVPGEDCPFRSRLPGPLPTSRKGRQSPVGWDRRGHPRPVFPRRFPWTRECYHLLPFSPQGLFNPALSIRHSGTERKEREVMERR